MRASRHGSPAGCSRTRPVSCPLRAWSRLAQEAIARQGLTAYHPSTRHLIPPRCDTVCRTQALRLTPDFQISPVGVLQPFDGKVRGRRGRLLLHDLLRRSLHGAPCWHHGERAGSASQALGDIEQERRDEVRRAGVAVAVLLCDLAGRDGTNMLIPFHVRACPCSTPLTLYCIVHLHQLPLLPQHV